MYKQMKDVTKPTYIFHSSNVFAKSYKNNPLISSDISKSPNLDKNTPYYHNNFLNLQKTAGNQVVQRLIKTGRLQTKLKISHPSDSYEQEADRVADIIVNDKNFSLSSLHQKNSGSTQHEKINRKNVNGS